MFINLVLWANFMEKIDHVRVLDAQGKSSDYIMHQLHITTRQSLGAYRANITRRDKNYTGGVRKNYDKGSVRREHTESSLGRLERYIGSDIIIPAGLMVERLPSEYVPVLAEILDIVYGKTKKRKPKHLEARFDGDGLFDPLPESREREVIIELKDEGYTNEEIHSDPRLRRVNPRSIGAYLANHSRGTYKKKRRKK